MSSMPKKPVNVTIDEEVLREIDHLAELRGESRSAVVERAIRAGLEAQREGLELVGSPVVGPVLTKLLESPKLHKMLADFVSANITEEEAQDMADKARGAREAGKKLRAERKNKKGR